LVAKLSLLVSFASFRQVTTKRFSKEFSNLTQPWHLTWKTCTSKPRVVGFKYNIIQPWIYKNVSVIFDSRQYISTKS